MLTAVALGAFVVLNGILMASGAYQVLTGTPSLQTKIAATIRPRLPATSEDCVLMGAAQVLQSVGMFIGFLPVALAAVPARGSVGAAISVAALVLALACLLVALSLALRVSYVRTGAARTSS